MRKNNDQKLRTLQDAFRETPTEVTGGAVPAALAGLPPDTPVMMYCTGGIRCDIYSAHLRKQGFTCAVGSSLSLVAFQRAVSKCVTPDLHHCLFRRR